MKNGRLKAVLAAAVVFAVVGVTSHAQSAGKETTLTGLVSDAMCGAHHMSKDVSAADCTRMCVKSGQGYALVVGDKTYTLSGHSPELDKYAGQKVTVKGNLNENALEVASVTPAK